MTVVVNRVIADQRAGAGVERWPGQLVLQVGMGRAKAELHLCSAQFDEVAIPQNCALNWLSIDESERTGLNCKDKSIGRVHRDQKMRIPHASFLKP